MFDACSGNVRDGVLQGSERSEAEQRLPDLADASVGRDAPAATAGPVYHFGYKAQTIMRGARFDRKDNRSDVDLGETENKVRESQGRRK